MSPRAFLLVALCFALCVQCLPIEPKFRQMSLESQEASTNAEIQTISSRIAFLQKLNKLTYDTTLFTRKLRWLLRRSLSEKPSVAEIADLMSKELDISKAQIDVAVEGVADELKLEVKQGIIALKAGLAFIEDNYVAGSNPEADAIIAKIKKNLADLEARFGKKFGGATGGTAPAVPEPEVSTGASPVPGASTAVPTPEMSSTAPGTEVSSTAPAPSTEMSSSAPSPGETPVASSTASTETPSSTASSEIASSVAPAASVSSSTAPETPASSTVSSTPTETPSSSASSETPQASTPTPATEVFESSSTGHNSSSSSTGEFFFIEEALKPAFISS